MKIITQEPHLKINGLYLVEEDIINQIYIFFLFNRV